MSFPRYPTYKESGVEWLGLVPQHWELVQLRNLARIEGGSTPSEDEVLSHPEEGHAWATPADMDGWHSEISSTSRRITDAGLAAIGNFLAQPGDILFSCRAPVGKVALVKKPLAFNQGCKAIVPKPRVSSTFLAWQIDSTRAAFELAARGTTFTEISAGGMRAVRLVRPPVDEQRIIAEFLDRETAKIDAVVEQQETLLKQLEEKRAATISHVVTKGLDPKIPMKDSGVEWLGQVPAHWDVLPLRSQFTELNEKNEGEQNSDYLSLVAGRGVIPYAEKGDIGNKKPDNLEKCKMVYRGCFVINSMNFGIGAFGVSPLNGVCSPVYVVLKVIEERGLPFLSNIFKASIFQKEAQSFGNGILAHRAAIGWDVLKSMKIGVPPLEERQEIGRYLERMDAEFGALAAEARKNIALLRERRSALISAAVTGRIDVRGTAKPATKVGEAA